MPPAGAYWLGPSRNARAATSRTSDGPSTAGNPWPRSIEPVRCASADISVKIVVPKLRRRSAVISAIDPRVGPRPGGARNAVVRAWKPTGGSSHTLLSPTIGLHDAVPISPGVRSTTPRAPRPVRPRLRTGRATRPSRRRRQRILVGAPTVRSRGIRSGSPPNDPVLRLKHARRRRGSVAGRNHFEVRLVIVTTALGGHR